MLEEVPASALEAILTFAVLELNHMRSRSGVEVGRLRTVPLVGDEVSSAEIKANPKEFVGRRFVMCAGLQIDDYWGYGYRGLENHYYSINLIEIRDGKLSRGATMQAYLRRTSGKGVADRLTATEELDPNLYKIARVELTLNPARYEGPDHWDLFELLDVQFYDPEEKAWQAWFFSGPEIVTVLIARMGRPAVRELVEVLADPKEGETTEAIKTMCLAALAGMDESARKLAVTRVRRAFQKTRGTPAEPWMQRAFTELGGERRRGR